MRVMVVGVGSIGRRHFDNIKTLGHDAVAVDITQNETGARTIQQALNFYPGSYSAAIVASPSHLHYSHMKELLETGLPCASEKPLCLEYAQAQELVALAEEKKLPAMVLQSWRYNAGMAVLRGILKSEVLGQIFYVLYVGGENLELNYPGRVGEVYASRKDMGGGVLNTNYSHFLDTIRFLFGEIETIHLNSAGFCSSWVDVETIVATSMMAMGNVAVYNISEFYSMFPRHYVEIVADNGNARVDFVARSGEVKLTNGLTHHYDWEPNDPYMEELKAFLECVEDRSKPVPVTLRDGARVVQLISELQEKIHA